VTSINDSNPQERPNPVDDVDLDANTSRIQTLTGKNSVTSRPLARLNADF